MDGLGTHLIRMVIVLTPNSMSIRRKKTPLEIWETGKGNAGRPRKITPEEKLLVQELAEIIVEIYLDEKKKDQPTVSGITLPV